MNNVPNVTDTPQYRNLTEHAREQHPEDLQAQIAYIQKHGTVQQYLCFLYEQAQYSASLRHREFTVSSSEIDDLFRALLDAVAHIDESLPVGVFNYIQSNSESFAKRIIAQS